MPVILKNLKVQKIHQKIVIQELDRVALFIVIGFKIALNFRRLAIKIASDRWMIYLHFKIHYVCQ